jgi:hypothetical protein
MEFVVAGEYGHFRPTKSYLERHERFREVSNVGDINLIFDFVRFNPVHAEALFVLAEFFSLQGNFAEANRIFESILRIFEDAGPAFTHALVSRSERAVPLAPHEPLNQVLLKTMAKQVDACIRKGTVQAAL